MKHPRIHGLPHPESPPRRPAPTSVRIAGAVAALGLGASAALHAIWLFSPWPLASWAAWSRAFGSVDFRVPAPTMVAVALLFAAAGYLVAARAGLVPQVGPAWIYRAGVWTLAAVLLLRSIVGFVEMPRTYANPATPAAFRETILLYLRVYLPAFGVLGALSAYVALGADRPVGAVRRRRPLAAMAVLACGAAAAACRKEGHGTPEAPGGPAPSPQQPTRPLRGPDPT